jgi:hypothetical protein
MIRRSSTPDVLQTCLSIYQFKSALSRKSAPLAFTSFRRPWHLGSITSRHSTGNRLSTLLPLYVEQFHEWVRQCPDFERMWHMICPLVWEIGTLVL